MKHLVVLGLDNRARKDDLNVMCIYWRREQNNWRKKVFCWLPRSSPTLPGRFCNDRLLDYVWQSNTFLISIKFPQTHPHCRSYSVSALRESEDETCVHLSRGISLSFVFFAEYFFCATLNISNPTVRPRLEWNSLYIWGWMLHVHQGQHVFFMIKWLLVAYIF